MENIKEKIDEEATELKASRGEEGEMQMEGASCGVMDNETVVLAAQTVSTFSLYRILKGVKVVNSLFCECYLNKNKRQYSSGPRVNRP